MNRNVFLATPISGFSSEDEYRKYRESVVVFISFLRANGFNVCSELENIKGSENYSSPVKSVEDDFNSIQKNDYFLLLHPARMQSSTLIEFGYACALNKKIVAVGLKSDFPFLVIGYEEYSSRAKIVEINKLSIEHFDTILKALQSLV